MLSIVESIVDLLSTRPILSTIFIVPVVLGLLLVYRHGWPKPLPGVPYNEGLGFFGDLPSLIGHVSKTKGELWTWYAAQNNKHKSALVQVFTSPFNSRPALLLTDAREAQDILLRRGDDFDRADMAKNFIRGLIPKGQITLSTGDEWKAHRALAKDLMTPAFLHDVSSPAIYERAIDLIDLWTLKSSLAAGKPFAAAQDIHFCALDAIFDAAFGSEDGLEVLRTNLRHLEKLQASAVNPEKTGSVNFATPPAPAIAQAIMDLDEATEYALQSMMPGPTWKILHYVPWFKRDWDEKETLLKRSIEKARDRIERKSTKEHHQRCALDNMVARELRMASKVGRSPEFHNRAFYDELFGFILGGHDTTSTTTQWAVKFLAENPTAQNSFRAALHSSMPRAKEEHRQPTFEEIAHAKDPYIDAIVEEIVRHSKTLPGIVRQATRDTTVLGHHVPKGTEVYLLGNGPGYFSPGFPVDEKLRSRTSQQAFIDGKAYKSWNETDMGAFKPERWLAEENGKVIFDKMAGSHLTFGLGTRGCFGRRLAYVELRLFLCLLVWNFSFEPVPNELADSSYVDKLTSIPNKCFVKLAPASS